LSDLQSQNPKINTSSHFNCFGLSDFETSALWFPAYQSFVDRSETLKRHPEQALLFELKTGADYVKNLAIEKIHFLKIDTEGFELKVLKGFKNTLDRVSHVQFEYGGTYLDAKISLKEVLDFLRSMGFGNFQLLSPEGPTPLFSELDHWQYCNILAHSLNSPSIFWK
jgi:FkbM family methyltransferase